MAVRSLILGRSRSARSAALAVALTTCALLLPAVATSAPGAPPVPAYAAALPGVTLLPPVGSEAVATGAFDPDADLHIEVFTLTAGGATGAPLGPSFSVAEDGKVRIKVHGAKGGKGHYHANWKTKDSKRSDGSLVRVEVRLPSAPAGPACNSGVSLAGGCLAYFDVGLTKGKKGSPYPAGVMGLTNGQTLPIKIHIAQGALDEPTTDASQLSGDPGSPAVAVIPDVDFEFDPDDYAPHPDLGGLMVSFRTLFLAFTLDTSVAQANDLLAEIQGRIIGGRAGVPGEVEGILYLRVPTSSHAEMDALIDRLTADPRVAVAVQDSLLEPLELPKLGTRPPGWEWEVKAEGDNWGLEAIRAPQLWNLNRAVQKSGNRTVTGVLDVGFYDHPDLTYATDLATAAADDHGTHVAGTIAASFRNGAGVAGVNPFADLVIEDTDDTAAWGMANFFDKAPSMRVVNASLGNNWYMVPAVDPALSAKAQKLVKDQAVLLTFWWGHLLNAGRTPPFIVAAAGNDSGASSLGGVNVDARWSSPFTYAGLVYGLKFIIVVEAVDLDADGGMSRASFSNLNGHISAPGVDICSTASAKPRGDDKSCGAIAGSEPYMRMSGTSMAAPHVAGVASYLLAIDPGLTNLELHELLREGATAARGGASPTVDAFASALLIDKKRGDAAVLKQLLDIDDGTADGNLRQECWTTCTEITSEDVDGDGGIGDGVVDMSDFRRWRDWYLQASGAIGLGLDGSSSHPKTDINRDGFAGPPETENVFPDGDFNGDGVLDKDAKRFVPGHINADASDLEVLQSLFADADYSAGELPGLVYSVDIHVDPSACMTDGILGVETRIYDAEFGSFVTSRYDTTSPMDHIYTLPYVQGGYIVRLEAFNSSGQTAGIAQDSFAGLLGSDSWFAPRSCGLLAISPRDFKVTLNVGESRTETLHITSAGMFATWKLSGSADNVEASPTEGTINGEDEVLVELTFTCPETPGRFQGTIFVLFTDRNGIPIQLNVPNWFFVDLKCLEGGVTVDPPTISMDMPMGTSNSRSFMLSNKGTEVLYELTPEDGLAIEQSVVGLLPTSDNLVFTVTATCPMRTGLFTRDVVLTFENVDGRPLSFEVPEKVTVVYECTGPLKLVEQVFNNIIEFETLDIANERYWSRDALGIGEHHRRIDVDDNISYVTGPIDPIGWGDVSSALDLTRVVEPLLPPLDWMNPFQRPGTMTGHASLEHHSSYDGTTATWGADFSFEYTTSRPPPNPDIGQEVCGTFTTNCSYLSADETIFFEIAPNTQQNVVITWTCGMFDTPTVPLGTTATHGFILLRGSGLPGDIFVSELAEGCSYETLLGPGRFSLYAQPGLQIGDSQSAGPVSGSYSVTLTYIPPEAP